jgi:hypothetical protein
MKIIHNYPETLKVTLELNKSEAAALSDLLQYGYDQARLGHDWSDLTLFLDSFCEDTVLECKTNDYPFKPVKSHWATEPTMKKAN